MHPHDQIAKGRHFVTGIRMATARPTPRRRWVVAALALALAVGSAGQLPRTQAAAAANTSIDFWLEAEQLGGKHTICVGDKVSIRVSLWRDIGVDLEPVSARWAGANVEASVDGSGVGTISPAKATTTLEGDVAGSTVFTFSAKAPGTTIVRFQAKVNQLWLLGLGLGGDTIRGSVPLTVEDCVYKVTTISRWVVPMAPEIGDLTYVALMTDAGMTAATDFPAHWTGAGSVTWTISPATAPAGDCTGTFTPGSPTAAKLDALVAEKVKLDLDVSYDDMVVADFVDCIEASWTFHWKMSPEPGRFRPSIVGGAVTMHDHYLETPGGPIPCETTCWVKWVRGQ